MRLESLNPKALNPLNPPGPASASLVEGGHGVGGDAKTDMLNPRGVVAVRLQIAGNIYIYIYICVCMYIYRERETND